jgi:DNA-binding transcriptional MerR regulator
MNKSAEAFRTIGEVADELGIPKHVLRFWEGRFPQIRPMKRGGGRRYYRPEDMELLRGIRALLHAEGYTIRGVQKILREHGIDQVKAAARRAVPAAAGIPAGAATTAAAPSRKRGRKAAGAGATAGASAAASSPSPSVSAAAAEAQAHVTAKVQLLAAIRELEIARAILLGQPLNATGGPSEVKKSGAGRS